MYKSRLENWYKYSSIRNKPRRMIPENAPGYYYPVARQPISVHPIVMDLGESALEYILIQSAYKFMRDIAYVEVELINKIAYKIYANQYPIKFIDEIRLDALSIIIDEAFHAYAAIDYMNQLERKTGVKVIDKSAETELSLSIEKFRRLLPEELQETFELIAGCIGENTLTKELFNMTNEKDVNVFFHEVMHDHMLDEGRHSRIFEDILYIVWEELDDKSRKSIGEILPDFLFDYLKPDLDIAYAKKILEGLNVNISDIETILAETYVKHDIESFRERNPIVGNIIKMLNRCRILDCSFTKDSFIARKLIN